MATHIRQTDGPSMSAILVRAEDNYGHFAPDRPPAGELDAAALAAHDRAMAPHASEGYATA